MIPTNEEIVLDDSLTEDIEEYTEPSITYAIVNNPVDEGKMIAGYLDDLEAVKQACRLMLTTERYEYLIYSDDYGIELSDLFGQPFDYIYSELKRRIEDALTVDERILGIDDYSCERDRGNVIASFKVKTIYGDFEERLEVAA